MNAIPSAGSAQHIVIAFINSHYIIGAEDYCNCFVCLHIYYHNFWETNNIGTSNELLSDFKLCKDQTKICLKLFQL